MINYSNTDNEDVGDDYHYSWLLAIVMMIVVCGGSHTQCIGNCGSDDSYQGHGDDDEDVDNIDCNDVALYCIVIAPSKIRNG